MQNLNKNKTPMKITHLKTNRFMFRKKKKSLKNCKLFRVDSDRPATFS